MATRHRSPAKQRTSREVYDRIRWDPQLDPGAYTIGYDAHAQGIKEVPYLSFVPDGDIPWHRVWYFRAGDRIVWDRRTRYDEVFSRRDESGSVVAPGVRWPVAGYFTPLAMHRFVDGAWGPAPLDTETPATPEVYTSLRVLTWNVLDGAHEGESARTPERFAAIPSALERADVDVIALQEVTPALWRELLDARWLRDGWWITEGEDAHGFTPHGVALLSRAPVAWAGEHRFRTGRRALALGLHAGVGPALVVAVHLPSSYANDASALRRELLTGLLSEGLGDTVALPCIVAGDFNAQDRELTPVLTPAGFADVWSAAGDGGAGITFEPATNPLAAAISRARAGQRLDRMYLRAGAASVRAESASLAVSGPVATADGSLLVLSDHWALRCVFEAGEVPSERRAWSPRTHRSALAMLAPDGEIAREVDAIRAEYDPSYERWPAHVNVLYGFVPEAEFDRAREAVRAAAERVDRFDLVITGPATFEHDGSTTVYLAIESDPPGALEALEGALFEAFPGCDEQRRHGAYRPHLTVGQLSRERSVEARALVDRLRASWVARRVPAPPLTLLARDEQGPFRVRAEVAVGRDPRDVTLSWLDELAAAVLYGERAEEERPVAFSFGSFALGDRAPGDLDIAVLGSHDVPAALFFDALSDALSRDPEVRSTRVALDALVPRLTFERAGVKADVCYARRPEATLARRPEELRTDDLRAMETSERRVVEGVREAATLRRIAGATVGSRTFLEALSTVKRWARARGVHGNPWGYLGGVSWALLVASACQGLDASTTVTALVSRFFARYSEWSWPEPVALTTARYDVDPSREPMPVLTTSDPPRNSARNVTRSTAAVLVTELGRARELTADVKEIPSRLFAPWNPLGSEARVTVTAPDDALFERCAGWLEGHAVGLVVALEHAGCTAIRPVSGLAREARSATFRVLADGDCTAAFAEFDAQWSERPSAISSATLTSSASKTS